MPAWNITTILAGVDFSNCQAVIVDGANRVTDYAGSSVKASDGTPHVQRFKTGGIGKSVGRNYGVNFPQLDAALLQQFYTAVETAEEAGLPFRVQMEDAKREIDDYCWPDYNSNPWLTEGAELEGIISDVTIRFESVAPAP